MTAFYTTFDSPIGPLLLMSDATSITGLHTENDKHRPPVRPEWVRDDGLPLFAQAVAQLRAYFEGALTAFDLPLAPQGTDFQTRVWRELCNIPFGETISYAELARRIGRPGASRAVGHSNARNPISIVVPCHRVIGADNSLTGYAGGLERKRALLEHEARVRGFASRIPVQSQGEFAFDMCAREPIDPIGGSAQGFPGNRESGSQ